MSEPTTQKITEKPVAAELSDNANLYISQQEKQADGSTIEVLRRVPLETLAKKVTGPLSEEIANLPTSSGGQPKSVTTAAEMTDTSTIYLYLGNEDSYAYGYLYVYQDGTWINTGLYGKGQDGETPEISVVETDEGITITVNGSSYSVKNGSNGQSPTITVADIDGGHRITVTDAEGTKSFDVIDGTATDAQVAAWFEAHPEVTTTVQDGAITEAKLSEALRYALYHSQKKTITQTDAFWIRGANSPIASQQQANSNGCISTCPLWIPKNTIITMNSDYVPNTSSLRAAVYQYAPNDETAINGWINPRPIGTWSSYTIPDDGYYVIYCDRAGLWSIITDGQTPQLQSWVYPVIFSYEVDSDFEPNYCMTVDWGTPGISLSNKVPTYSNGLNLACRREPGFSYSINTQGFGPSLARMMTIDTLDLTGIISNSANSSDILAYKDELWIVTPGGDDKDYLSNIVKFKVYDNGWIWYLGQVWTNLGHCNSMRYDEETDTLIWGNGSGSYELEGEAYIINNFSACALATSYAQDSVVLFDDLNVDTLSLPIDTYGFKTNVISYCNREPGGNNGEYRKLWVALLTNDGNTIRYGAITPTVADGTMAYSWSNVSWFDAHDIGDTTESQANSYVHCVQGMDAYNNQVFWGVGHAATWLARPKITPQETIKPTASGVAWSRASGIVAAEFDGGTRGVAIYQDKLWVALDTKFIPYNPSVLYSIQ